MIYRELPFWGGGDERAPERFFAKVGIQPGTIAFIGNVHIPGIKPDITLAKETLNWSPKVKLKAGLEKTISYFDQLLAS
jgi:nucleoside-diphosphate-sugar epimerase